MENWIKDANWKVVFPKKIFIMKHYNWVFVGFDLDLACDKGWIKEHGTLVHVEQHLDAAIDGLAAPKISHVKGLDKLSNLAKCEFGNREFVGIDNIIGAGCTRGTSQSIIYVSPEKDANLFNTEQQTIYF